MVELWRGDELLGAVEPDGDGLRLVLGDADPGGGLTLLWGGEPVVFRFDLSGGGL